MSVKNKVTRISRCIIYRVIFHSKRSFYLLFPLLQAKTRLFLLGRTQYHLSVWYFWSIGLNFNTKTAFMDGQARCRMTVYIHISIEIKSKGGFFKSIYFPSSLIIWCLKTALDRVVLFCSSVQTLAHSAWMLFPCAACGLTADKATLKQFPVHESLEAFASSVGSILGSQICEIQWGRWGT